MHFHAAALAHAVRETVVVDGREYGRSWLDGGRRSVEVVAGNREEPRCLVPRDLLPAVGVAGQRVFDENVDARFPQVSQADC